MGYIVIPSNAWGPNAQGVGSLWTNNQASTGSPGTDPSDAPGSARTYQWLPYDTTLKSLYIHTAVAPGSGKTVNYRVHNDSDGDVSAIQQITGAASQDVSNIVEETMPGLDTTSDTTIRNTITYLTAWASTSGNAVGNGFPAFEYLDSVHPGFVWYLCAIGADIAVASYAGTDSYAALVDSAILSSQTSQSARQIRMPIAGTLRYAWAVWRGWTNTTTVEAVLQKGTLGAGSDTAIALTMVGAGTTTPYQATLNTATTVTVAQGDYLNWRITRTAGAATTGAIALGIGFSPGVV